MKPGKFKRLVNSPGNRAVLDGMAALAQTPFAVVNMDDERVYGEGRVVGKRYPIMLENERIGSVIGDSRTSFVADFLSQVAAEEVARRNVANEALERYKEITLLYSLGEKLTSILNTASLADLIVEESLGHMPGDFAALYLLDPATSLLQKKSARGESRRPLETVLPPGAGLLERIFNSGIAEIVNDAAGDPRSRRVPAPGASMMVAPLKVQERILGVVAVGTIEPHTYASADLKFFTAISSQGAYALDNSLLYSSKLEEDRIKQNLERYVPAQLVDAIIDSGGDISLEPHNTEITILFSDIRNFTVRCENLPAADIVNYLNTYFSEMVDLIFKNQGTINKFVGDMIVALFGAPSPIEQREAKAVRAAIDMQKRMAVMDDPWIRDNFHTGIGINSGDVVVGNIGSRQHMDYTAIGDEVNVASRLQALARGGQILVTEKIQEKTRGEFEYREFDHVVTLKGKQKPVRVYEVMYR